MNKIFNQIAIIGLLFLINRNANAQFTLSAEFRPRTEYVHGIKSPVDSAQNPALFTSQRARLSFDYKHKSYETFLSLQDIRTWGSEPQLNFTDANSSVHEAWGKINFNKKSSIKLGRQEVIYDDQRIFGSVNWTQQARSHDAAIFRYKDSTLIIDFGGAYNQNSPQLSTTSYNVPNSYKSLQLFWLNKTYKKLSNKMQ